jgi:hypothetical protein
MMILICADTPDVVAAVQAIPLATGWGDGRASANGLRLWAPDPSALVADPGCTVDSIAAFLAAAADPVDRWWCVDDPAWQQTCQWLDQAPPLSDAGTPL